MQGDENKEDQLSYRYELMREECEFLRNKYIEHAEKSHQVKFWVNLLFFRGENQENKSQKCKEINDLLLICYFLSVGIFWEIHRKLKDLTLSEL